MGESAYHRGYVAGILYQMPANPATPDLTALIRDVPPKLDLFLAIPV
jgi:hypothetical protein